jgi:hypothetical protein
VLRRLGGPATDGPARRGEGPSPHSQWGPVPGPCGAVLSIGARPAGVLTVQRPRSETVCQGRGPGPILHRTNSGPRGTLPAAGRPEEVPA